MAKSANRFTGGTNAPAAPGFGLSVFINASLGFLKYSSFTIDGTFTGNVGGTLDVYIQRATDAVNTLVPPSSWVDWVHFPQLAAADPSTSFSLSVSPSGQNIVKVGLFDAAGNGTPVLAAGSAVQCLPGNWLRIYTVSGAGTAASGGGIITLTGFYDP